MVENFGARHQVQYSYRMMPWYNTVICNNTNGGCGNGCLCLALLRRLSIVILKIVWEREERSFIPVAQSGTANKVSIPIPTASGVYTATSRPPSCQLCCVYMCAYYGSMHSVHEEWQCTAGWLSTLSTCRVLYIWCMLRMAFSFRDEITNKSKIMEYLLFGWF
jgi:hypothetical protein